MARHIVIIALFSLVFGQWLDLAHLDAIPVDVGEAGSYHLDHDLSCGFCHDHSEDDPTGPHIHMGCHILHHVAEGGAPASLHPPRQKVVLSFPASRSTTGRALAPPVPPPLA